MLDDLGRMENMVTKILDSARLDRGRANLRKERVNLHEAAGYVVSKLEDIARREKVAITVAIDPRLEVEADPMAVDGVLRNLVENAINAMVPTGGGKVTIAARATEHGVALDVADTGVGFEPVMGRRLFDKFFRLDAAAGRDSTGTGLGLFIVQRFM